MTITIPHRDITTILPAAAAAPTHEEEEEQPPPQRKKKKTSFTFSKQRFMAASDFYIRLDSSFPPPQTMPDLLGQIVHCPSKNNGNNFEVRWCHQKHSKALVPPDLLPHLRTKFPKEQYKESIRALIQETSGLLPSSAPRTNRTTTAAPNMLPPTASSLIAAAATVLAAASTPPSMLAQTNAALAAIYTAGTSTSGWSNMSSLGHSQRSLFQDLPTQSQQEDEEDDEQDDDGNVDDDDGNDDDNDNNDATISEEDEEQPTQQETTARASTRSIVRLREPDSDDEVTIGEDTYELNRDENFWHERHLLWEDMQRMEEEADEEEEQEDEDECNLLGPVDISELLRSATNFGFTEVLPEDVPNIVEPQPIYNAPFGLKEGIADLIQTPLDAFRHSGFTEELVARWTKNSNK